MLKMSYCDNLQSFIRPSTPSNDFSSETLGPISFKLHVKPSAKGGLTISTSGHGLLSKMAAMPIYDKNI